MSNSNIPKIIFEDDDVVVFDKPAGMVVNRSHTTKERTLQDFVEEKYGYTFEAGGDEEFISRSGIIHRLDKDTSGLVLVAKNPQSFFDIQRQFRRREVSKTYVAIVNGEVSEGKIEINAPIGRNPKHPLRQAIVVGGRESVTKAEKVKVSQIGDCKYTVLHVNPLTGRTHQIRVHMAALGHPVAGDIIYSNKKQYEQSRQVFPRMMLHAQKLSFVHPKSKDFIQVESSLPDEFSY